MYQISVFGFCFILLQKIRLDSSAQFLRVPEKILSIFLNFNAHYIDRMHADNQEILSLISKCRDIRDIPKKTRLLEYINQLLPTESKIKLPSLITSDGIDNMLSWIEVKISPPVYGLATP